MRFQESNWRKTATPIIAKVLVEMKGKPEKEVRTALKDAYPFGQRKYHPYKIWLDEIKRQTGHLWPIGHKVAWLNAKKRKATDYAKLSAWEAIYGTREQ